MVGVGIRWIAPVCCVSKFSNFKIQRARGVFFSRYLKLPYRHGPHSPAAAKLSKYIACLSTGGTHPWHPKALPCRSDPNISRHIARDPTLPIENKSVTQKALRPSSIASGLGPRCVNSPGFLPTHLACATLMIRPGPFHHKRLRLQQDFDCLGWRSSDAREASMGSLTMLTKHLNQYGSTNWRVVGSFTSYEIETIGRNMNVHASALTESI